MQLQAHNRHLVNDSYFHQYYTFTLHRTFVTLREIQMRSSGAPSPGSEAYKEVSNTSHRVTVHQDGNKYSAAALGGIVPMVTTLSFFSVRSKIIALGQFDLNPVPGHQGLMLNSF